MDKHTARNLHRILAPLGSEHWHRAIFLSDDVGRILYTFGVSDVLKVENEEVSNVARKQDAAESLYLTSLDDRFFVGVLFDAEIEINVIRDAIRLIQPQLEELVKAS